jgi:hypothetical protein
MSASTLSGISIRALNCGSKTSIARNIILRNTLNHNKAMFKILLKILKKQKYRQKNETKLQQHTEIT